MVSAFEIVNFLELRALVMTCCKALIVVVNKMIYLLDLY